MKRVLTAVLAWACAATGCAGLPRASDLVASSAVVAERYFNYAGPVRATQTYRLRASGGWVDGHIAADGRGYASRGAMRYFEGMRRHPQAQWFSLVAVVAQRAPGRNRLRIVEGPVDLGPLLDRGTWTPARDGYLFLFANDVPFMYWNNTGELHVQIVPVAP